MEDEAEGLDLEGGGGGAAFFFPNKATVLKLKAAGVTEEEALLVLTVRLFPNISDDPKEAAKVDAATEAILLSSSSSFCLGP